MVLPSWETLAGGPPSTDLSYVLAAARSAVVFALPLDQEKIERFLRKEKWNLQQVQDFIPLPMTPATAMYVTGLDFDTEQPIPVVRNAGDRERQKHALRPNQGSKSKSNWSDTVD